MLDSSDQSPARSGQTCGSWSKPAHAKTGSRFEQLSDRAGRPIEAKQQREVMETATEFLRGEGAQTPELLQDPERDVLVLWKDRELLEAADLLFGKPSKTCSDGPSHGSTAGFEIFAIEGGQSLGIQRFIHLLESLLQGEAVALRQLPPLTVDDLQEKNPPAP